MTYPDELSQVKRDVALKWTEMLSFKEEDGYSLKDDFCMAYLSLLEGIRDNDSARLQALCEKNLFREFQEAQDDLYREVKEVEILNLEDKWEEKTKIEVVHAMQYYGVFIDRERNRENGIHRFFKQSEK